MEKNVQKVGAVFLIVGTVILTVFLQSAYTSFMTYKTNLKFTCFGECQSSPSETELKYINFKAKQQENKKQRLAIEIARQKEKVEL